MSDAGAVSATSLGESEIAAPWLEVDLAVIGSGAAGLSAAITAASRGMKVAVFEKDDRLGGTSAWCSGWMWIPGGASEREAPEPCEADASARTYLEADLGAVAYAAQRAKIDAYLAGGRDMLRFFSALPHGLMTFEGDTSTPDFHAVAGQALGGRMVRAAAFDGRVLGADIERFRGQIPELTVFGLAIESGVDLQNFIDPFRSRESFAYIARRVFGYLRDWWIYGRGMWLVNGNALVARLVACALRSEADARRRAQGKPGLVEALGLFASHPALRLIKEDGAIRGVWVDTADGPQLVRANKGVVLACGGFPHDMRRISALFPPQLAFCGHRSAAPVANVGDGLRLGENVGGRVQATLAAAAAWAPVSVQRRMDGSAAVYPHFIERAKPGFIAVNASGQRFCDEAIGYHDFVARWLESTPKGERLLAWLICDRCALWSYGLGTIKPRLPLLWGPLRSGYLQFGWTLEKLAAKCGIDARGLRRQVDACNAAAPGADPQFHRGESAYDRSQGDAAISPNPCVAPILRPPFFAVRLQPGSLGTLAGLVTDARSRVLDAHDQPIAGLYACGNDMAAVMGGFYPANGVSLGTAMTFGHLAGLEAAQS